MSRLLFALLSCLAIAQADDTYFIYPPNTRHISSFGSNAVLQNGSVVEVKWYSNISTYTITLWQQFNGDAFGNSPVYDTTSGLGSQSWNWTVSTFGFNSTISPVYFFWLNHGKAQSVTTDYFNISAADSSSSPPSSSSSSGMSSTIAPTSSAATSSASPTTPASSGDGQSSSATTIGLGVGLGVGIPLVLLVAAFFGFQAWRNRRSDPPRPDTPKNYGQYGPAYYAAPVPTSDKAAPPYTSNARASKVYEAPEPRHADPTELSG